ncbi:hypothetical protein QJS10_CPA05g02322 [Acorus calamus]|uniref:DUF7815 domain-containing protein n=1 Tax=Acorus calamus TaxID=4465 RepID=A0AAV9ER68_ACOCL|nr:hypothetical protein QJS10_CPA05g02322 [Acorus calamus]
MTERALEVSVELTKTNHPRKTKTSTEATMAVDHPSSVIKDLQVQLRREAGVASYDPNDPSLLSSGLPSLEDLIAGLDPSPDYLRCRRCRGRLLRGVRSTICVFCGADRSGEASASAEISFNTTAAYRHLIESLGLDGSEPVMVNTGSTESNKGRRNASKEGLVLSDILDFKMQWPMESEKKENTNAGKAPTHGIYPLNLSGADLDNFFSKTETNAGPVPTGSSPEQLLPKKENHTSVPESSGLFGDIQSSNSVTRSMDSKESESAETVTVWEADFQSASFETRPIESKLDDPFSGIPVNHSAKPLSTAVLSIPSKDIEIDYKIKDDGNTKIDEPHHSSSSDNQIQDDMWDAMSARVADEQEQSSKRHSRANGDEQKSSSPTCDDWFTDNLFPPGSSKAPTQTNSSNQNDDVSDDWQDFASSMDNAPGGVETGIENENNSSIAEVDQERKILNNSASVQDDWFQDQLFSASNITTPKHTEIGGENDSPLDDWQCLTSSGVPPPMKISEGIIHDDQLDDWQDFTSSENMPVDKTNESNKLRLMTEMMAYTIMHL